MPGVRSNDEMNIRATTIATATVALVMFVAIGIIATRFDMIFRDLFDGDVVLPFSSRLVLGLAPAGWIAVGVLAATGLVLKDQLAGVRRIPNWPFGILLVVAALWTVVSLFRPLIITIHTMK